LRPSLSSSVKPQGWVKEKATSQYFSFFDRRISDTSRSVAAISLVLIFKAINRKVQFKIHSSVRQRVPIGLLWLLLLFRLLRCFAEKLLLEHFDRPHDAHGRHDRVQHRGDEHQVEVRLNVRTEANILASIEEYQPRKKNKTKYHPRYVKQQIAKSKSIG